MKWKKHGLVFQPLGQGWRYSHAYIPTPYLITPEILRIYIAFLDSEKVGRIGYVDLEAANPKNILAVSDRPALDIGGPGCFDDHGVTPMTIVPLKDRLLMYYTGWQLSSTVRYYLLTGLAESFDGGKTFTRISKVPILERSDGELIVRSAAHVHHVHDQLWKMWYIGGSKTIMVNGKQVPTYSLCYAESRDGLHWPDKGRVLMEPQGPDEYGFGRPWIEYENGTYKMWYSIRTASRGYHLGYATSENGLDWRRQDEDLNIGAAPDDWYSEMSAFGAVINTKYGKYIFFNGNEYGRDGFGCARLIGA